MTAGAFPVFETEDSAFFVGGRGTKAGDAHAGGCLKSFWGDLDSPGKTLADVMGTNGEVLSAGDAWDGCMTACSITLAADTCHILITKASAFPSPIAAGLVANCKFHALSPYVGDDGRYEILSVPDANSIVIDIVHVGDDADHCDVKVGGAFDILQTVLDDTDANTGTPQNVFVLTNKVETFTGAGDEIDNDAGGGDLGAGTWKRVVGIDSDGVELADGEYLLVDADGQAVNGFEVVDIDNVAFYHIHVKDATGAGFRISNTSGHYGYHFNHCKATGGANGFYNTGIDGRNISIFGGHYEGSSIAVRSPAVIGFIICDAYCYSPGGQVIYLGYYGGQVKGCIIVSDGTGTGIWLTGTAGDVVIGNVMYNVTHGIHVEGTNVALVEYNNIIVVGAKAAGKAINRVSGTVAYSDYSCMWAIDGAPAASDRWGGSGMGPNSIEADPLFVDAANGDFRLQLSSPCLRTGRPTLGQL